MKINRLRLKGFIGIKKGLGLDEIELDFSDLSGLIAFAGPNGHGKTTILDCLQPYRQMASRNRSLQHHCFLRDSEKELSFEFQGDQYRTLLKIDAESERSEGYIWKNGESLVDGKVTNYDKAIIDLLGSPNLFFNSVFCAQNSKKLSEMTTGDLKKLFSEFLKLEILVQYEDTAKQCGVILAGKVEKLNREIESLKTLIQEKEGSAGRLEKANEESLKQLSKDLEEAEAQRSGIQAVMQKNELLQTQITGMINRHGQLGREIYAETEQSESELSDLRSKFRKVDSELVGVDSLLTNEQEIRDAAKRFESLSSEIEGGQGLLEINAKKRAYRSFLNNGGSGFLFYLSLGRQVKRQN
jgi:exonuclease SbcC